MDALGVPMQDEWTQGRIGKEEQGMKLMEANGNDNDEAR